MWNISRIIFTLKCLYEFFLIFGRSVCFTMSTLQRQTDFLSDHQYLIPGQTYGGHATYRMMIINNYHFLNFFYHLLILIVEPIV